MRIQRLFISVLALAALALVPFGALDAQDAEHEAGYEPPFAWKESYAVENAFSGFGAHAIAPYQYGVDFLMPVGSMVHAARGGVVKAVKSDSNVGGASASFDGKANYIEVEHRDGTTARYLHLMQGGVEVRVGQTVVAGEHIGYSGNTGWTTAPHLHFDVMVKIHTRDQKTIPFAFKTRSGKKTPVKGLVFERTVLSSTEFPYTVTVKTKDKWLAGTDARVYLTIKGSKASSAEEELVGRFNPFERNATDTFYLYFDRDLGDLLSVRIRHDDSGVASGWWLDWIRVQSERTGRSYEFPCNKWLAKDEGDKSIDRTLPVR